MVPFLVATILSPLGSVADGGEVDEAFFRPPALGEPRGFGRGYSGAGSGAGGVIFSTMSSGRSGTPYGISRWTPGRQQARLI